MSGNPLSAAQERLVRELRLLGKPSSARDIADLRGQPWRAACGIGKALYILARFHPDLVVRENAKYRARRP
jgi:hypothetical protein